VGQGTEPCHAYACKWEREATAHLLSMPWPVKFNWAPSPPLTSCTGALEFVGVSPFMVSHHQLRLICVRVPLLYLTRGQSLSGPLLADFQLLVIQAICDVYKLVTLHVKERGGTIINKNYCYQWLIINPLSITGTTLLACLQSGVGL
jgi:hypothetical protein